MFIIIWSEVFQCIKIPSVRQKYNCTCRITTIEWLGIDQVMKWIGRGRVCSLPSVGDNCIGIFCVRVELRQVETTHTMSCGLPMFLVVVHQTFHIRHCILVRYFFHWKSPRLQYKLSENQNSYQYTVICTFLFYSSGVD